MLHNDSLCCLLFCGPTDSCSQVTSTIQSDPIGLWARKIRKSANSSRCNKHVKVPSDISQNYKMSTVLDPWNGRVSWKRAACQAQLSYAQVQFLLLSAALLCMPELHEALIDKRRSLPTWVHIWSFRSLPSFFKYVLLAFQAVKVPYLGHKM